MDSDAQRHLELLAGALTKRQFSATVTADGTRPYLTVANQDNPTLNERVYCHAAPDGSWCFWWPWHQPIGSVGDLESAVTKITTVLRTVEGGS